MGFSVILWGAEFWFLLNFGSLTGVVLMINWLRNWSHCRMFMQNLSNYGLISFTRWLEGTGCGRCLCFLHQGWTQQIPRASPLAGVRGGGAEHPPLPLPRRSCPLPHQLPEDAGGDPAQPEPGEGYAGALLRRDRAVSPYSCLPVACARW